MNRGLRARHALTWVLLGPALVIIIFTLLALRPAPAGGDEPPTPAGAAP